VTIMKQLNVMLKVVKFVITNPILFYIQNRQETIIPVFIPLQHLEQQILLKPHPTMLCQCCMLHQQIIIIITLIIINH